MEKSFLLYNLKEDQLLQKPGNARIKSHLWTNFSSYIDLKAPKHDILSPFSTLTEVARGLHVTAAWCGAE